MVIDQKIQMILCDDFCYLTVTAEILVVDGPVRNFVADCASVIAHPVAVRYWWDVVDGAKSDDG